MAGQGGGERGGSSAEKKDGGEAPTTAPEMQSSEPRGSALRGVKWVLVRPMAPDGRAEAAKTSKGPLWCRVGSASVKRSNQSQTGIAAIGSG